MKALTTLTDPVYTEPEKFTRYEKFWLKYINDKRDLPFIHLLTAIHIFVIPAAIILYTPLLQGWYWWLLYIPYFYVSQMYFKGRFGLMLHCISHRKLFKKGYTWLYNYVIWFVCPFFGHTPETYFAHHMGMHHVENNMPQEKKIIYAPHLWRNIILSFLYSHELCKFSCYTIYIYYSFCICKDCNDVGQLGTTFFYR